MICLEDNFALEKINLQNEIHVSLLDQIFEENPSESSFIWNFKDDIAKRNPDYLHSPEIIDSPFAIFKDFFPIGFLDISAIFKPDYFVDITYTILKKEQGKRYATKVLLEVCKLLLLQYKASIQKVKLMIDPLNLPSICVAHNCGFYSLDTDDEAHRNGIYVFEKKLGDNFPFTKRS